MQYRRRATLWLLPVALLIAVVIVFAGPATKVVCGKGHWLDRVAQSLSKGQGGGHTDGPSASYCVVPSDLTWIIAGGILAAALIVVAVRGRRARPA
jgi:hypothetical protein